jgi:Chaperone of endosialidase
MARRVRTYATTLVAAVVTALVVAGPPVAAHVTKAVKHTWKHLQPLADARYMQKGASLPTPTDLNCTGCIAATELGFDPATQTELDSLATGDGNAPNLGSNRLHWQNLTGVPADFQDGVDDGQGTAWFLAGNSGTNPNSQFLGTTDNAALNFRVNNARALRLVPNASSPSVIGGWNGNSVSAGVVGAVIGGGGNSVDPNTVTDDFGTVGGGQGNQVGDAGFVIATAATVAGGRDNTASNEYTTVGGGRDNTATGDTNTIAGGESNNASGLNYSTIGGGFDNTASEANTTIAGGVGNTAGDSGAVVGGGSGNDATGVHASIGGGDDNTAAGDFATVAGGELNSAAGTSATVPGGSGNSAAGNYGLAAGRGANAGSNGAFVWGDSQAGTITAPAANTFTARAAGGFFLEDDNVVNTQSGAFLNTDTGAYLSTGGAWTDSSSATVKENFQAVDPRDVLDTVSRLPITTWNYRGQDTEIRHIGPVAEDFHSAFGVGESERHIAALDTNGVALAAIQGLNDVVLDQEAQIARLEEQLFGSTTGSAGRGGVSGVPWQAAAIAVFALGLGLAGRALRPSALITR